MTNVWVTGLQRNPEMGQKQGFSCKNYGHDWEPGQDVTPLLPDDIHENMNRHAVGQYIEREGMPEAAFVYNKEHFKKLPDYFFAQGFNCAKGKWAKVLSEMNLGKRGGLVPFSVYEADKETLVEEEHFLVNFDNCSKDTLIVSESPRLWELFLLERDGVELWTCSSDLDDGGIALNSAALSGVDWWFEKRVHAMMFMSDRLVQAIHAADIKVPWDFKRCTIMDMGE